MKVSDHPAAQPRRTSPSVSIGADAPIIRQEAPSTAHFEAAAGPLQGAPDDWEPPSPEPGETGTGDIELPQPTRETIASAPQDGAPLTAYWGPDDETGRLVRWRQGRHYNNRRWVPGGCWAPADGTTPLPAENPTEWLKPPETEVEPIEEEAEEAA